ncbi:MAG: hypothetical protein LLG04_18800 [Parachlamydia sp.]|nr:hypothetical protein [Parachlamydia sp.]
MVYKPTIPAANDRPAQSQSEIQENFTQANTQITREHNAFDSAAADGKHKFVTLQRSAGVPPAGTDIILAQALTVAGNPYAQIVYPGNAFLIPLVRFHQAAIPAGSGTRNIFNFGTSSLVPQSGTIEVYDMGTNSGIVFGLFIWDGVNLNVPGATNAQLGNSSTYVKLQNAGAMLQLVVSGLGAPTNISVKIMGTAI